MVDLSRVGERGRLSPRPGDEPHWHRLRPRCSLGYRPSRKGGLGTWFARVLDEQRDKYVRKGLGAFPDIPSHQIFSVAKREAEAWADEVEAGGLTQKHIVTVRDACEDYLSSKPNDIAEGVFRRHVYPDTLSQIKLDKLRRQHLREWRKRLEETPALISRNRSGLTRTKARSAATVNRDMVPLRAALNRVLPPGPPATEAAWQEALKPAKNAVTPRTLYLDMAQRKRLVNGSSDEIRPFIHAMCLLPIRVGAMAALRIADLEPRTLTITIGRDKSGKPRQIAVPASTMEFLLKQSTHRLPEQPIFCRSNGRCWDRNSWKRPIKCAAEAANLPTSTTAYTLRHSVITDLVMSGQSLFLVAKLAGTGVQMIEDHYGHLVRDKAENALETLHF